MLYDVDSIEAYFEDLPEDRRQTVERLYQEILAHLPAGFEIGVLGGMIKLRAPVCLSQRIPLYTR